jgi:hypothetical protein
LNLVGGVRSSAAFLASDRRKYNPYGLIEIGAVGGALACGKLLDDHLAGEEPPGDDAYRLGPAWRGARLPRFREVIGRSSVVGTWDPERGDHQRARFKEPTGSSNGELAGILTRVGAGLAHAAGADPAVPAFHVAPVSVFGQPGGLDRFVPVSLAGANVLPDASDAAEEEIDRATGRDWARDDAMRERLDREHQAGTGARNVALAVDHRRASRSIGVALAEPWLRVASEDETALAAAHGTVRIGLNEVPLTNAMLRELAARSLGVPLEEAPGFPSYGNAMNLMLAVRLLQLDSAAVTVEIGDFDFHSGEREGVPLYRFLGRVWAWLGWLFARMPDPAVPGSALLDTTLVVTLSEFGRDPGSPATGYNGGMGCDHGSDPSCYYLAHALMGAGVAPGKLVAGVSTSDYRGDRAAERYQQVDLIATLLWSLGLDWRAQGWGFPHGATPIVSLWGAR